MAPKRSYTAMRNGQRKYSAPARPSKRRTTATSRARAALVPGYTRTGGSYGRYGVSARLMGLAPEKKYFDTDLSFNIDATGEVPATGQLCLIPQGDTENTRDGRKAVIESVQIRGMFSFTPAAAVTAIANCHMYLVLDTQCNGAAAAATDVFTGTDFRSAMLNLNNSGRFRILKHWYVELEPQAGATTAYNQAFKQLEYYKKCKIPVDWSSTTGAITEIRSNNIFLLAGCNTAADDLTAFVGTCRLRFRG